MDEIDGETIQNMLKGIDRYNPENLTILEPYVRQQIAKNFYDLSANLAVLKLSPKSNLSAVKDNLIQHIYQFNPAYFQEEIVCDILLKAIASLPSPDFTLCECLIEQHHHETPQIGRLIFLHQLLETCEFRLFWREVQATPELITGVTGFETAIRKFICQAVSISYQHIKEGTLRELLGDLEDEELEDWIKQNDWTRKEDQLIFVTNQEEIVKSKNIVDKVNFEKVHSVMSSGLLPS